MLYIYCTAIDDLELTWGVISYFLYSNISEIIAQIS